VLRDLIDIASPSGDHHRLSEVPAQQHGGNAIRIEVVRINGVELIASRKDPSHGSRARYCKQEGRGRHADLRRKRIARMQNLDAMMGFPAWRPRERSVAAKYRMR